MVSKAIIGGKIAFSANSARVLGIHSHKHEPSSNACIYELIYST